MSLRTFFLSACPALLVLAALSFTSPTQAAAVVTQSLAENGRLAVSSPFFQDDTNSRSVVQASIQFSRLQQATQLQSSNILDFGTMGNTYWIALTVTNNSRAEKWSFQLVPEMPNKPSPIKTIHIYDVDLPEKPLAVWPDLDDQTKAPHLPVMFPVGKTSTKYAYVETWPGLNVPVIPVLKTTDYIVRETTDMAQKISLLWLIMGAVCGAGLVQMVLTRQGVQGILALNGLILGVGIFVLQRPEMIPAISSYHPLLLPLVVSSLIGIGASLMLWAIGRRYGATSLLCVLPLLINIAVLLLAILKLDVILAFTFPLESLPSMLLTVTGLTLIGISLFLAVKSIELVWFIPAWIILTGFGWLMATFSFGAPILYAIFLTIAGVASVFSFWKSMDSETEALQKRLRYDLRSIKEKYDEQNSTWEKKMASERVLLNELRQREQQRSAELEIARKEADGANKAKSDFLAIISHEIRTPMNGIMGIMQLLDQTPLNEKQREFVDVVKNSGDTMVTLLNDILDYSKIEKGAIDLEKIPFTLRSLVSSIATLMSGRAKDKGLGIDIQIANDVPDSLSGDPNRIRQILLNLVSNALKFTEKGGITIKVIREAESVNDQVRLRFEVIDTGIGISDEALKKLFQAYVQADASISRRFGGTGLGLNICRMLVTAMEGEIGVTSNEGQGSVFSFTLPLEITHITFNDTVRQITSDYRPTKKLSIIVVDDNNVNLKILSGLLEIDGHTVVTSESGERSLQLIEKNNFDLMFIDLMMPGMDGKSVVSKLRKNPNPVHSHMPVYALTGLVTEKEREEVREVGMQGLLPKPVTQQALRAVVETVATKGMVKAQQEFTVQDVLSKLGSFSVDEVEKLRLALLAAASPGVQVPQAVQQPENIVVVEPASLIATKDEAIEEPQTLSPIEPVAVEQKQTSETSALDPKKFLNFAMLGDLKASLPPETLQEIFAELIEKSKELVSDLEEAAKFNEVEELVEAGHNLKGMAGNFGLEALMNIAGQIEHEGRHGDTKKAVEHAKTMRPVLDDTLIVLDQWIKS